MSEYCYQSLSLSCSAQDVIQVPCPDSGLLHFSGEFTIELWVKTPIFQTEKTLVSQKGNFNLGISNKKLVFSPVGGMDVIVEDPELYESTWHSIVCIVYQKDIRILVDGNLCTETLLPDGEKCSEPIMI